MGVADIMRAKLTKALAPEKLDIIDQSDLHAGHAGAREGGESHFRIHVICDAFAGKSRLARQRLINEILKEELAGPIHALTMELGVPEKMS